VADAARTVASAGRPVSLHCPPEIGKSFVRLGLDGLPGIRLVTADDR
jgi:hypothetical protein